MGLARQASGVICEGPLGFACAGSFYGCCTAQVVSGTADVVNPAASHGFVVWVECWGAVLLRWEALLEGGHPFEHVVTPGWGCSM